MDAVTAIIIAAVIGAVTGALVVAAMVRRSNDRRNDLMGYSPPKPAPTAPQDATALLSAEQMAKLRALVDRGRKIEAIKLVRDWTKIGLTEAKDLVESL